jgi:hypothetical protein
MAICAINNPPFVKISKNITRLDKQWERLVRHRETTLLGNMRNVTYLLKTTVATTKLLGQVLNRRTGTLIRALLPNSPEMAGRMLSNGITIGTVGVQGAIAPYGKIHEMGGTYSVQIGAGSRGGFGARGGSKLAGTGKGKRKSVEQAGADANAYMRWAAAHPPSTTTRVVRGRWYIMTTIKSRAEQIRAMLSESTMVLEGAEE